MIGKTNLTIGRKFEKKKSNPTLFRYSLQNFEIIQNHLMKFVNQGNLELNK